MINLDANSRIVHQPRVNIFLLNYIYLIKLKFKTKKYENSNNERVRNIRTYNLYS